MEFLHQMWEDTGVIPPALANRPVLLEHLLWTYRIWGQLSGSRQQGMKGHSLIAFSEVALYGLAHSFTNLELADLWDDLHRIDKAWHCEVTKIQEAQAS